MPAFIFDLGLKAAFYNTNAMVNSLESKVLHQEETGSAVKSSYPWEMFLCILSLYSQVPSALYYTRKCFGWGAALVSSVTDYINFASFSLCPASNCAYIVGGSS